MKTDHRQVYVIAEAGVNHNGNLDMALELVDVAARAGADAVKFQTFRADALARSDTPLAAYQEAGSLGETGMHGMLRKLELSEEAHELLIARCHEKGIDFLSTPFDPISLKLLLRLALPRIKVGSGDLTNAPLLYAIAKAGKPIVLSTGMSNLGEIEQALQVIAAGYGGFDGDPTSADAMKLAGEERSRSLLQERVVLLHCTSAYPAEPEDVDLLAMRTLSRAFGLPVGYSDHTRGTAVSIAAVALGARVIEKHFTLDRTLPGPDHAASLQPDELTGLVTDIRVVSRALGSSLKGPHATEVPTRALVRKSLVAAVPISAGEAFTLENVTLKRPADGLPPDRYWSVLGRMARRDFRPDEPIEI